MAQAESLSRDNVKLARNNAGIASEVSRVISTLGPSSLPCAQSMTVLSGRRSLPTSTSVAANRRRSSLLAFFVRRRGSGSEQNSRARIRSRYCRKETLPSRGQTQDRLFAVQTGRRLPRKHPKTSATVFGAKVGFPKSTWRSSMQSA